MALLTADDLSIWTRQEILDTDEWAFAVIEAASDVVRVAAGHPEWTITDAPARARQIASHLAARSYLNPTSIQGEGALGPLGGDRFVEELAKALHLTPAEITELGAMSPSATAGGGSLWIQPTTPGAGTTVDDIYLADDSGSDWMIPYLAADDLPALG